MDWFLYDNGPRHERVNPSHPMYLEICIKWCLKRFYEGLSGLQ